MNNPVKPVPCKILEVKQETKLEYTFKVEPDIKPSHGQFLQLSIPKVGEAPISVSAYGDGWIDFTIRSVGKVTDKNVRKKQATLCSCAAHMARAGRLKSSSKASIWY